MFSTSRTYQWSFVTSISVTVNTVTVVTVKFPKWWIQLTQWEPLAQ